MPRILLVDDDRFLLRAVEKLFSAEGYFCHSSVSAEEARQALAARSAEVAAKKADRETTAGSVGSYVHSNAMSGAIIVLGCETDFVANNEEFKALARDMAMHACAMMPETVEEMLTQPFVKDGERTVKQKLEEAVQKFGENTQLLKIARLAI